MLLKSILLSAFLATSALAYQGQRCLNNGMCDGRGRCPDWQHEKCCHKQFGIPGRSNGRHDGSWNDNGKDQWGKCCCR